MSKRVSSKVLYICNHIRKNWTLASRIIQMLQINDNEDRFGTMYIRTEPTGDPIFESSIPKAKYWTLCFINTGNLNGNIYMLYSDHDDGVYKHALTTKNGLVLNYYTPCLFGLNSLNKGERIIVNASSQDVHYVNVDWNTGEPFEITGKKLLDMQRACGENKNMFISDTNTKFTTKNITAENLIKNSMMQMIDDELQRRIKVKEKKKKYKIKKSVTSNSESSIDELALNRKIEKIEKEIQELNSVD